MKILDVVKKSLVPDHRYLVPGYKAGARAWLQRMASRLTTEKSLVPEHRYLVPFWAGGLGLKLPFGQGAGG